MVRCWRPGKHNLSGNRISGTKGRQPKKQKQDATHEERENNNVQRICLESFFDPSKQVLAGEKNGIKNRLHISPVLTAHFKQRAGHLSERTIPGSFHNHFENIIVVNGGSLQCA